MQDQRVTASAGGVVRAPDGRVLVVNQRGDSWSLPKGHIDPGETAEEAARRETHEEAGITDMTLVRELGTYERYKIGKDGDGEDTSELKRITMFLFDTEQTTLDPIDENHPEARWVAPDEVAALLTHPKDAAFFEDVRGQCD